MKRKKIDEKGVSWQRISSVRCIFWEENNWKDEEEIPKKGETSITLDGEMQKRREPMHLSIRLASFRSSLVVFNSVENTWCAWGTLFSLKLHRV